VLIAPATGSHNIFPGGRAPFADWDDVVDRRRIPATTIPAHFVHQLDLTLASYEHTVALLIIETLDVGFLWGRDLRILVTPLRLPPTTLDPSGSIVSNATVLNFRLSPVACDGPADVNVHEADIAMHSISTSTFSCCRIAILQKPDTAVHCWRSERCSSWERAGRQVSRTSG
jgi:hypothetical protein